MGKRIAYVLICLVMVGLVGVLAVQYIQGSVLRGLTNGQLEGADYWGSEPAILSAGMGFDNIIGLPAITQEVVQQAGGSWFGGLRCTSGEEPSTGMRTSAAAADTIGQAFKGYADYNDGLPVVFSRPVATETVEGIHYDGCYQEDRDNYIDIILVGDQAAAENVTAVEIPGLRGGYRAFYNPGGPGPEPFAGIPYTAPGPRDLEPVVTALNDPMRVSRDPVS